jgi:hypothetical protein
VAQAAIVHAVVTRYIPPMKLQAFAWTVVAIIVALWLAAIYVVLRQPHWQLPLWLSNWLF